MHSTLTTVWSLKCHVETWKIYQCMDKRSETFHEMYVIGYWDRKSTLGKNKENQKWSVDFFLFVFVGWTRKALINYYDPCLWILELISMKWRKSENSQRILFLKWTLIQIWKCHLNKRTGPYVWHGKIQRGGIFTIATLFFHLSGVRIYRRKC